MKLGFFFGVALIVIGGGLAAMASNHTGVVSRLSSADIFLSDRVTLEIDVNNADQMPVIEIPEIEHVRIVSENSQISSSSTIIINGKMTKSEIRTFRIGITPRKIGRLTIPPIKVIVGNTVFHTSEFNVNVETPPSSEHMYLKVFPDKQELFVNETITFQLQWYLRTSVENYQFLFSPFDDADVWQYQPLPVIKNNPTIRIKQYDIPFRKQRQVLRGYEYTLYSLDVAFRAINSGTRSITPSVVSAVTEDGTENRMDVFGRTVVIPKKKRIFAVTPSKKITVKPLPEFGKPDNFTGSVGQFSLQWLTDVGTASIGDKIPISMIITGNGFFGTKNEKIPEHAPGLVKNFNVEVKKIHLPNQSTFKVDYYITPLHANVSDIPALSFAYFDPKKKEYRVSTSKKYALTIVPQQIIDADDVLAPNTVQKKLPVASKKTTEFSDIPLFDAKINLFLNQSNTVLIGAGALTLPFFGLIAGVLYSRRMTKIKLSARTIDKKKTLGMLLTFKDIFLNPSGDMHSHYDDAMRFLDDRFTIQTKYAIAPNSNRILLCADLSAKLIEIKKTLDFLTFSGTEPIELNDAVRLDTVRFFDELRAYVSDMSFPMV